MLTPARNWPKYAEIGIEEARKSALKAASGTISTEELEKEAGGSGYILSVTATDNGGASGTVTSSPAGITICGTCNSTSSSFNAGTVVTLTATPASGSTFQGWSGACSGTGTCSVTMNSAQSVNATFALGNSATTTSSGNFYNVIGPTFSTNGNSSYIRLGNSGTAATTFSITVLGSPSGAVYGTAQLQVPANASPQYALSAILTAAGAGPLVNGDNSYTLYMQDADSSLSYQHVMYSTVSEFFENVSSCHYTSGQDYSYLNSILYNVHTSLLANYPAQIYVYNYAASAATYNASIYDNNTGNLIGTVPVTIPSNSTYSVPFTWFEQQLNWTPSSAQLHANIKFTPVGQAPFQIEVTDYIFNQKLSAYVNMTQRCGFLSSSGTGITQP